jgi:hypothetical protein
MSIQIPICPFFHSLAALRPFQASHKSTGRKMENIEINKKNQLKLK